MFWWMFRVLTSVIIDLLSINSILCDAIHNIHTAYSKSSLKKKKGLGCFLHQIILPSSPQRIQELWSPNKEAQDCQWLRAEPKGV